MCNNNNSNNSILQKIYNNKINKNNLTQKRENKERKKRKLVSSLCMRQQYFVTINLLGKWGSIQMTVMSEGLPLKTKSIENGSQGGGFSSFHESHSHRFAMSLIIWTYLTVIH